MNIDLSIKKTIYQLDRVSFAVYFSCIKVEVVFSRDGMREVLSAGRLLLCIA
jgi:hypothetical protein